MSVLVPLASTAIMSIFTILVFWQYLRRRKVYQLVWGIGLAMFSLAVLCEFLAGMRGWNPLVFRLWYLCGAILVAAWLGQGTVYLLARRSWANVLLVILLLGSLYGAFKVFTAQLDPTLLPGTQLSGDAITSGGVRILTPFFNIYGLITLVGGAIYSAWVYWRRRIFPNRVVGTILIAVGALSLGLGGTLSRFGLTEYLYLSELLGAILIFIGFLKSTGPEEAV